MAPPVRASLVRNYALRQGGWDDDVVRTGRVELPFPCGSQILSLVRLPIPPRSHAQRFGDFTLRIATRWLFARGLGLKRALVEVQGRERALAVLGKFHLGVHCPVEEFGFRFGEYRELTLTGSLRHQLVAFEGDYQIESGPQFISAR